MKWNRTVVAFTGVSLVLMVAGAAGWLKVTSLDSEIKELRSKASVEERNLSQMSEELAVTRDDLLRTEETLKKARQRARRAQAQARGFQDCIDLVSDEGGTRRQTVVFAFVELGEGRQLLIDGAEWYIGDEATREALKDGEIDDGESVPNDYYIRNEDESVTPLAVARDVVVVTTTADRHNIPAPKCKTWAQFATALEGPEPSEASLERSPYWLTVRNSEVVRIVEQYLP